MEAAVRTRPRVMGVVNVTPDSFSDGGHFVDPETAAAHAARLVAEGAELIDIGGESTRPGAEMVASGAEIARIIPALTAIRRRTRVPISVDTTKPEVASAAMAAGAGVWNDITALTGAPDSADVAAALGCGVVLMHMQGDPRNMQVDPSYRDVVAEVADYLAGRAEAAMAAGVRREAIWLDPGIGFGKRLEHNLALLAHLDTLTALGFPVLLGVSRKSFLRAIDPDATGAGDRLGGSLAAALAGVARGAAVIRAHDVRETVQALSVWAAVEGG